MAASSFLAARIVLLLLVLFAAAPAPARARGNKVKRFCAKTENPEACARALSAYPESRTASVGRLAELTLLSASRKAEEENAAIQSKVKAMKRPPQVCIENCVQEIDAAAARLANFTSSSETETMTDAEFADAKRYLTVGILETTTSCGQCASSEPLTPEERAVTEKGYHVWNDLVAAAKIILTASPLPPATAAEPPATVADPPSSA